MTRREHVLAVCVDADVLAGIDQAAAKANLSRAEYVGRLLRRAAAAVERTTLPDAS